MEKPNTKKKYFNYKRDNSLPNSSYALQKQIWGSFKFYLP